MCNRIELEKELYTLYKEIAPDIKKRLSEFREMWQNGTDEDIFYELLFCLLTPQSKATSCWKAATILRENNLAINGTKEEIASKLNIVRFKNNKAGYIIKLRERFCFGGEFKTCQSMMSIRDLINSMPDNFERRTWLHKNIKGMGLKEASHFLRNVGFGDNLSILDRHILRNLVRLDVIDEIPKTLSEKKYLEIEEKMRKYADKIKINMAELDILLWYREVGEIFK